MSVSKSLKLMVLLLACLVSIGCKSGRKPADLNGNWGIDVDKSIAELKNKDDFKKKDEKEQKAEEDMMRKIMPEMTFTIADNKISMKMGGKSEDADMKIVSSEGNDWKIETTDNKKKTEQATLTWIDNDHITLSPASGDKMYLVKKP